MTAYQCLNCHAIERLDVTCCDKEDLFRINDMPEEIKRLRVEVERLTAERDTDTQDLDEMLMAAHLSPRASDESLRSAIDRLMSWHISVQLDPQMSSAAAALVEQGRASPKEG